MEGLAGLGVFFAGFFGGFGIFFIGVGLLWGVSIWSKQKEVK